MRSGFPPSRAVLLWAALVLSGLALSCAREEKTERPQTPIETDTSQSRPANAPPKDRDVVLEPPRPVGQWPTRYAALLPPDAVAAVLIDPVAVAEVLQRTTALVKSSDVAMATELERLLGSSLGEMMQLATPAAWDGLGFDSAQPVLVVASTGPGTNLLDASRAASAVVAAQGDDMVQRAREGRARMQQAGLMLRVALPTRDTERATAFARMVLPSLLGGVTDPIKGYDATYGLGGPYLLSVRQVDGFLLLDSAFFPWLLGETVDAHSAASRRVLEQLHGATDEPRLGPGLPAPLQAPVHVFASADLATLVRLHTIALVLDSGEDAARLGEVRAPIRFAEAQCGEQGRYRALSVGFRPDKQVDVDAYFQKRVPGLATAFSAQPALHPSEAAFSLSFAPQVASQRGIWAAAGLGATGQLDLTGFIDGMVSERGIGPLLVPTWAFMAPGLVWRDLVPSPARYIDPAELERAQIFVAGKDLAEAGLPVALALLDRGGNLEAHRHGLACLTQRRPVQGSCRDDRIAVGQVASAKLTGRQVHYLLEQRDDIVLLVIGTAPAVVEWVRKAPLDSTATVGQLQIDVPALARAPLDAWLTETIDAVDPLLRSLSTRITVDDDGIHWVIELEPSVSLARLAAVATPAFLTWVRKGKEVEALVNLEALATSAAAFGTAKGHYPVSAEPTCSAGGQLDGARVESAATDWTQGVWGAMSFAIPHNHVYRFCYQTDPDGRRFAAWAEGSLGTGVLDSRLCVRGTTTGGAAEVGAVESVGDGVCTVP